MAKKTKDEINAADVSAQLERLARLTRAASYVSGLNPAQWDALRYIARTNRFSNSPKALTQYLATTKGTVSQTLASLVKKGLLTKIIRAGNNRSVALTLTELGKTTLRDDPLLHLEHAIDNLSGKTKRRFARGTAELLDMERQRQNQPGFGTCQNCRYHREDGQIHKCMLMGEELSVAETKLLCVEQTP
jgi:DNA-binding MarR family transcriptional regulator